MTAGGQALGQQRPDEAGGSGNAHSHRRIVPQPLAR
jgi:hypothetical protein